MKKLFALLLAITMMATMSLTAFAAETTYYDLWVAGVQVTSDNTVIDSTDNEQIQGSATYDEATKTFTLTNFKYTGEHDHDSDYDTSALSVRVDGITIVFSGENIIEGTGTHGLYAAVAENIELQAADENSTLIFKCENENGNAFAHRPVLVGDIDIYAGSNEGDATLLAYDVFTEYPYSYKYVRFVPAEPEAETKSTTVTYEVAPTYTVTIPTDVTIDGNSTTISAEDVVVEKGKYVSVTLAENNDFTVKTAEGAELTYTVTANGENIAAGDEILAVNPADGKTGTATVTFDIDESAIQYAGTYTGTAIFTVAVKDAPKPLISFTIDGTSYQAEEGMTWGDWVNSEYDNDEFSVDINAIKKGSSFVSNGGSNIVYTNNQIVANTAYVFGSLTENS